MIRRRPLLLAAAAPLAGCAALPGISSHPVQLPGTRQFDVTARDGVTRRVMLGRPRGPRPAEGWPVLLVLDGNAMFPTALMLTRNFAQRAGYTPALVVGIGYPDQDGFDDAARARDYTPPAPRLPAGSPHGGAGTFLDFLAGQAREAVREEGGDPARMGVFGHSFGGLLVLHALFTRPGLFDGHVAASPSLWWQDRATLAALPAFEARMRVGGRPERLLLTVGSLEQTPPSGLPPERAAIVRRRRQVEGIREFARRMEGVPGLACALQELPGETHGSSALPALQRAVAFLYGPPA